MDYSFHNGGTHEKLCRTFLCYFSQLIILTFELFYIGKVSQGHGQLSQWLQLIANLKIYKRYFYIYDFRQDRSMACAYERYR